MPTHQRLVWIPTGIAAGVLLIITGVVLITSGVIDIASGGFVVLAGTAMAVPATLFYRDIRRQRRI